MLHTLAWKVTHGEPLPEFINLQGKDAAVVCSYANSPRKLNAVTMTIHGHSATAQAIVMRNYLAALDELAHPAPDQGGSVIVYPVSSLRSCKEQEAACNGICHHGCAGCPGLCAPCGHSGHQYGACFDSHIAKHPDRTYPQAYQRWKAVMIKHGFNNFAGWERGSDTMHTSWQITV